jgi:class 3 adenylate cyclase
MVEVSGAHSFNKQIVDGKMVESFAMAETTEAGNYNLNIFAYDSNEYGILNQKTYNVSFQINQVARSVVLSPSNVQLNPGESFEFGVDILDQSGKTMEGNVNAVLISPLNEERSLEVKSGESGSFVFATNDSAGVWRLIANYGLAGDEKEVTLAEKPKIEMKFLENTTLLIVWNVGNAPYKDKVTVNIGNETQILELNILPGEERRFNLQAPRGTYEVGAASLDGSIGGTMLLTGRAISVTDWNGINLLSKYPLIWVFIVGILLLAGIIALIKFKKTQFKFKDRIKEDKHVDIATISANQHMKRQFLDLAKPAIDEADSVINMSGKKDYSSVVCVHLKNPGRLTPDSKTELTRIINGAKSKSGVVDWKGNHVLIIFSPLITKTYKNELLASRTAFEIMTSLNDYNKRFTNKIEFNIGINCGDLVSSLQNGKLNYTSLGNTVILSKRISDLDSGKMLVSGEFRNKLMRELKVDSYKPLGNTMIFSVNRISDIEANNDKLKDILKRMDHK